MTKERKIAHRQCRFIVHVPANKDRPDLHLVKEVVTYDDGSTEPKLTWIKQFSRSFYVTSPQYRSHQQKKEIESLDHLMQFKCTQSDLRNKIAEALGMNYSNDHLKKLSNSPYLYGSEISSQAIIKKLYQNKNKTHNTPYSVMMFDIETDMNYGTEDPIIITAVTGNEIFLSVTQEFIKGISNPEPLFRSKCAQYVSEFVDLTKYKIIYKECNGVIDLIRKTFEWIHSKQVDFLAIWNINFDWPKLMSTLEKHGVDPKDVLCDPSIPKEARVCKYREGLTKKRKASGQEVPIDFADQWHTVDLTASFYPIDAMCTYRLLRLAKPKEPSYSLDAILDKELGIRKLKFKEADGYVKDRWHMFMQANYKVEYMVYAMFDSLSMKLLDDKILDLCFNLPGYAGITPFSKCNSKPKMIADALHFYALEHGYALNSIGEQLEYGDYEEETEEDDETNEGDPRTMDLRGWIMTLPSHLVSPGLALIKEDPKLRTMIRGMVYDSDCVSAYPTCTSILNVSKSTTKREIVSIEGIEESVFRLQNINLCSGYVNALEYGVEMFGLPKLTNLESLIE